MSSHAKNLERTHLCNEPLVSPRVRQLLIQLRSCNSDATSKVERISTAGLLGSINVESVDNINVFNIVQGENVVQI
jgi:hypothetical protein